MRSSTAPGDLRTLFHARSESPNFCEYLLRTGKSLCSNQMHAGQHMAGMGQGGMRGCASDGHALLASEVFSRFRSASASVPSCLRFLLDISLESLYILQDCI